MNFTNSAKINFFTIKCNKIMDKIEKQTRKISSSKKTNFDREMVKNNIVTT